MLGKLLSSLGLGQSDLINVTTMSIERLGRIDLTTAEMRKGQRQALQTMLDVLRDEDVLTIETKRTLEEKIEKAYRS
jgi:hypothetical protein